MIWQSNRRLGLMIALLGAAAIFLISAAPDNTKPEKIVVGTINWNNTSQSFDVPISLQASLAERAARDGYVITTVMHVADATTGAALADLGPQTDPVVLAGMAPQRGSGMVPLVPQMIPWDRNGGTFEGDVVVSGVTALVRPDGKVVARDMFLQPVEDVFS
jgi:hypothetical protein